MSLSFSEFVSAVIDAEMIVETDNDKIIVTRPAIGMNDRFWVNVPPDNAWQRGLTAIRDDLGIDDTLSLEQSEGTRLAVGTRSL